MATVHPLTEQIPMQGEEVFVFDACYSEWVYAQYEGSAPSGTFRFLEGYNRYGEALYTERPTHFFRVQFPGKPGRL